MEEADIPEINSLMVFLNEQVELDAEDAPIPAIKLKQLKDFFRQRAKGKALTQDRLAQVNGALS
jgi:hypothetical protein